MEGVLASFIVAADGVRLREQTENTSEDPTLSCRNTTVSLGIREISCQRSQETAALKVEKKA